MARYIDADKLLEKAEEIEWFNESTGFYNHINIVHKYDVETAPTADVVPKSEADWLYKQVDCLSQEVMYNDDIAKMKVDEAKAEVAREIFADIERLLMINFCSCLPSGATEHYDYFEGDLADDIAELKKKYLEDKE